MKYEGERVNVGKMLVLLVTWCEDGKCLTAGEGMGGTGMVFFAAGIMEAVERT